MTSGIGPLHAFAPDYAVPPGETLRARLAELQMSQAELAVRSGFTPKHINQVVRGIAPISYETAAVLERVTGVPSRLWNALEANYRQRLAHLEQEVTDEDIAWAKSFPLGALRKVLPKTSSDCGLYEAICTFFGVADRLAWTRLWLRPVGSFRRSRAFESDPAAMASWLRLGELQAQEIDTDPFDAGRFRKALQRVRKLTRDSDFGSRLVEICAEAGVAVVFVPELPKCRVSGAARWLSPAKALIQLSDRYKHDDFFWFSFFHEAAHLLLHPKKETYIDDGSENDGVEAEANRFAATTLIPAEAEPQLSTLVSAQDVRVFAEDLGIAPGIVVGRLHHDRHWDWSKGNQLRRKIHIVETE